MININFDISYNTNRNLRQPSGVNIGSLSGAASGMSYSINVALNPLPELQQSELNLISIVFEKETIGSGVSFPQNLLGY